MAEHTASEGRELKNALDSLHIDIDEVPRDLFVDTPPGARTTAAIRPAGSTTKSTGKGLDDSYTL